MRHRVVALCLDGLVAFDLTAPAQAFGARGSARRASRSTSSRPARRAGAAVRTTSGFGVNARSRPRRPAPAPTRSSSPATPGSSTPPPEEALRGAARGRTAAVPGALGLHRRLRARPRRPARRPPGDDPLGLGGRAGAALPGGRGRPRRALRRRGRGADLGRAQRRHRPQPARGPHGLRRRRRRAGRPPHGRGAAPRGRPGAVLQVTSRRRSAARSSRPGAGRPSASPSRSTSPRWSRHAGVSPRTFARRFREETGTTPLQWLLAQRVLEARRLLEESDLPVDDDRLARRLRHRRLAARPLPPRDRDHPDRLPALLPARHG